jgi:hypothetical protein
MIKKFKPSKLCNDQQQNKQTEMMSYVEYEAGVKRLDEYDRPKSHFVFLQ